MKKDYFKPLSEVVLLTGRDILCESPKKGEVEDLVYEEW